MNNYGELVDATTVRFERILPGPIERVWAYIVQSDKRRQWLCAGDIGPGDGGRVDMHFDNDSLSTAPDIEPPPKYRDRPGDMKFIGKVTRWEPPRAVSHTWEFSDEESSEVCYQLEEYGDQVKLTLTHRRLESDDTVLSVSGGWHTHLDILEKVLTGREPGAFWRHHAAVAAEYRQRLGA
ncbi:MAG: SRPBCC family protein [Xanthomonadales bacterium]|nr:SRPBCC family protein [Xanthomonadales bacterium]